MYYDVSSVFSLDFLLLSLQKVFNFAGNSIKGNILRKTHLVEFIVGRWSHMDLKLLHQSISVVWKTESESKILPDQSVIGTLV